MTNPDPRDDIEDDLATPGRIVLLTRDNFNEKDHIHDELNPVEQGRCRWSEGTASASSGLANSSRLETRGKARDLALFSVALDSMLRSSDILQFKVGDVCGSHLKPKARLTVQQQKTGKPVSIELNDYTRGALSAWILESGKDEHDFLFTRRGEPHGQRLSTAQYRKLVKGWVRAIGLNPDDYSTHSLRRTLPSFVYHETKNIEAVRNLLGQSSVTATSRYLNVAGRDSLNLARPFRI